MEVAERGAWTNSAVGKAVIDEGDAIDGDDLESLELVRPRRTWARPP